MGDVEEAMTEVMNDDQLNLEQLHDSANQVSPQRSLGNSTVKHYLCGVAYLQSAQHHLLYGDMHEPKLSSLSILTQDAKTRRRKENQRKNESFMDAARHAPELPDPDKEARLADFLLKKPGAQQQLVGLRTFCLFLYGRRSAGRGESARNLRPCQRLNLDVEAVDDGCPGTSAQVMEVMAFTKDTGKTSSGDTRELTAIAPHKDVS